MRIEAAILLAVRAIALERAGLEPHEARARSQVALDEALAGHLRLRRIILDGEDPAEVYKLRPDDGEDADR